VRLETWDEHEDPFARAALLLGSLGGEAGGSAGPDVPAGPRGPRAPVASLLVSDGLRAAFVLGLQRVLPGRSWDLASSLLAPLRRVKDPEEVALLRAAAEGADRVIEAIIHGPLVGRTEAQVAAEVRRRLVDEGHDSAEFAIVASGPNSASPHHEPGDRVLEAGEPLLLDIGGRRRGYCSDTTRTFWLADDEGGAPDAGFAEIHALTERAQAAARTAVRPGVPFAAIDAAARDPIGAAGYGEHFFHRLGHGIGLEVHEEPWVIGGNAQTAMVGDAFSIEPGVYLEGRYGVRIEDILVCTPEGAQTLNAAPRELRVIPGRPG
jgi:Xaa-Pro aminopeptidase